METNRLPRDWHESQAFSLYQQLTMPPGALAGIFEPLLRVLAQQSQKSNRPYALNLAAAVFAGDHAVVPEEGVSAFPPSVTGQMVANFLTGGAAMSVLCGVRKILLSVVDVGVASTYPVPEKVATGVRYSDFNISRGRLGYEHGSRNLAKCSALDEEAFAAALFAGRKAFADITKASGRIDVLIVGEMGIGNTTPASAIIASTLNVDPSGVTGPGTGLTQPGIENKIRVIERALKRHHSEFAGETQPEITLRSLGGFEIVAMAGAALTAMEAGTHVLLDGVIATAALLPWVKHEQWRRHWLIPGHVSAEPAHRMALDAMKLTGTPLLDLGLRLGEGSGAALAAGLLLDALTLLNGMATFESAAVTNR